MVSHSPANTYHSSLYSPPLQLSTADKDVDGKYYEDFLILKSFDRVFWLRYYGAIQSENLEVQEKEDLVEKCKAASSCFFDDPATTKTCYGKAVREMMDQAKRQSASTDEEDEDEIYPAPEDVEYEDVPDVSS